MDENLLLVAIFTLSSLLMFLAPMSTIYIIFTLFKFSEMRSFLKPIRSIIIYAFGSGITFMFTSILSLIKMILLFDISNLYIAIFFIYGMIFQSLIIMRIWILLRYEYVDEWGYT